MKKVFKNQSGFSYVEIIFALVVIVAIFVVGWIVYKDHLKTPQNSNASTVIPVTNGSTPNSQSSFAVKGNKILYNNQQYIPLGVTVFGISKIGWQGYISGDIDQIKASASFWHANIVRIQVSPYYLNNNTPGYLNAVKEEVSVAESVGLNVIISAQYQNTKTLYPLAAPDNSTVRFWNTIAPLYSNDDKVWFDLFNEPTANKPYNIWKNGGNVNGVNYVGMQTLVTDVRKVAPNNIILAEGINDFTKLQGFTGYALNGGNIVYSVHPYFDRREVPGVESSSWWQQNVWAPDWGNYASQYPIIIGEWGEYQGPRAECVTNAAQLVPAFLSYASSLHLGLIGWSLTPGTMINGTNLDNPTSFTSVPYSCTATVTNPQGAGSDILKYFTSGGNY